MESMMEQTLFLAFILCPVSRLWKSQPLSCSAWNDCCFFGGVEWNLSKGQDCYDHKIYTGSIKHNFNDRWPQRLLIQWMKDKAQTHLFYWSQRFTFSRKAPSHSTGIIVKLYFSLKLAVKKKWYNLNLAQERKAKLYHSALSHTMLVAKVIHNTVNLYRYLLRHF